MRRRALLYATSLFLGGVSLLAAREVPPEVTAQVEVSGKLVQVDGAPSFRLTVSYLANSENALGDALLIFGEPSHTLLFAHVDTRAPFRGVVDEELGEKALSLAFGRPGRHFQHALSLAYNPSLLGDTRVEVVMRWHGQSYLLASGRVNVSDFQYSTTFSTLSAADGFKEFLGGMHCCSGPMCGKICATCPTAFFSCDLINCKIDCETN
jgi:hypothetical protein